jgi:hypothetical protein
VPRETGPDNNIYWRAPENMRERVSDAYFRHALSAQK